MPLFSQAAASSVLLTVQCGEEGEVGGGSIHM